MMNISVQQVYDQGSGKLNEDELLIQDNLFAVFDGASSRVSFTNAEGKTGAKLAAEIAKKSFSRNDKPLSALALDANKNILSAMQKEGIDVTHKEALWSTTAAAVRVKRDEAEFFLVCDCCILVIRNDGSYFLPAPISDQDVEVLQEWKQFAQKGEKDILGKLSQQLDALRRSANTTWGLLNGEPAAEKFFRSGSFPLAGVRSILLFTDGLFLPKKDPTDLDDWAMFVKLYQEKGLQGVLGHVRSIENGDKYCWEYIRYKQHDDVAGIGIDFV
jgi:serine/threonine protein phosphatase PrpC